MRKTLLTLAALASLGLGAAACSGSADQPDPGVAACHRLAEWWEAGHDGRVDVLSDLDASDEPLLNAAAATIRKAQTQDDLGEALAGVTLGYSQAEAGCERVGVALPEDFGTLD